MKNKMLLFYPSTANKPTITLPVPILAGIANKHKWDVSYYDTTNYKKRLDAIEEKEKTGGFQPGITKIKNEIEPFENLVPDIQTSINKLKPKLLCITTMSCDYQYLITFFSKIKIPKNTMVVIGGVHAILRPDDIIKTGLFDIVCTGQGEKTFDEILSVIEKGQDVSKIKGTFFLSRKTGEITKNPRRELLTPKELWKVNTDYSFYSDKYFYHPFDGQMVRMFWMEVARGCPYNCTYCGNSAIKEVYKGLGNHVATRPMDSIFRHFDTMIKKYKIDVFNITDECFLAHPIPWLKDFAWHYAKNIRKPFLIQTRPETVTEERLDILKSFKAPFFQVGMGVESGSERILFDICNRKTSKKSIIKAYDLLKKYGIRSNAYFMIGFPTETRKEVFETIKLCRRIDSNINVVSIFQPQPGQKLTQLCIDKKYITGKEPLETFTSASILKMPQLSAKEITELRRCFMLYAKLPLKYYKDIEKCELDYENNRELFDKLVDLRWKYDKTYKKIKIA